MQVVRTINLPTPLDWTIYVYVCVSTSTLTGLGATIFCLRPPRVVASTLAACPTCLSLTLHSCLATATCVLMTIAFVAVKCGLFSRLPYPTATNHFYRAVCCCFFYSFVYVCVACAAFYTKLFFLSYPDQGGNLAKFHTVYYYT